MNKRLPKRILDLLKKLEPYVRDAFISSINDIKKNVSIDEISKHLTDGRIDLVIESLQIEEAIFEPLARAIEESYFQGGRSAAASIPSGPSSFSIVFNARLPRAEHWLKTKSSTLVTAITNDQREMIRSVLVEGMIEGANPRDVARGLSGIYNPSTKMREGGFIGLTKNQTTYVTQAKKELKALNRSYFQRELRDKRYDGMVRRAIKSGKPLTKTEIDLLSNRYQDRLLKYRADAIARTEALSSLHASQYESLLQAVDSGKINEDQIVRVWDATGDKRTRPDHIHADGQKVGLYGKFFVGGEFLSYPGDQSGSAHNTINCRCWVKTEIDFFKGVT